MVDNRPISLKHPLEWPEYEHCMSKSGVAPLAESLQGAGIMKPLSFVFRLKLLLLFGLGFDP